jgi:hypothetical protein
MLDPGNASLIGPLYNLAKNLSRSAGARYLGSQLQRTASQPMPFVLPNTLNLGASPRTSGPNVGGQLGNVVGRTLSGLPSSLRNIAQPQAPENPLVDLYSQLIDQLQQPANVPTGIDTKDLMSQIQKAINPIYDQRAKAAEERGGRYRKEVTGMYKALADDYKQLAPQQLEQAQQSQEDIQDLYGQLRSNIKGDYARVSADQANEFQRLGIEDALPDVLSQQQAPVEDALVSAAQNQAQQQQRYMDIGNTDAEYYREGSPNAILTGNNINTDMLAELGNYLDQVDAERTSGIQSGYLDQLSQAQNRLAQQQQVGNEENARRQAMLWEMLQAQTGLGKYATKSSNSKSSALDSLMGTLSPDLQQRVASSFTQLQRSPESIYGKVEDPRNPVPGTFVETTPEWYMAQADELLKRGQIDEATHQALLQYLQLYYAKGN